MKKLFLFYLLLVLNLEAKSTVCLNMIVKNESHVIKRALDSVKPLIDYWVIVDTGSTDGTQDIIRSYLQDIPGELHEMPWVNFAYNRSAALDLAKDKCSYLLFLDADDWLEYPIGLDLKNLKHDIYLATWHSKNRLLSYRKPLVVKSSLPWKWESVLHEYLTCGYDNKITSLWLQDISYIIGADGARSKNPRKYHEAAELLQDALKENPEDPRYLFYLAESLRDAGELHSAISAYENYLGYGVWDEEIFWALFQIAQLKAALNFPFEEIKQAYLTAHYTRPHRPEPIYYLAKILNEHQKFEEAYSVLKRWIEIEHPHKKDLLFCLDWILEYGIDFELSLCSYYIGSLEESLDLHDRLLRNPLLPLDTRNLVLNNRKFPLAALKKAS